MGITATGGNTTFDCSGQTLDIDAATVQIDSTAATAITAGTTLGITATGGNTTFDCSGQTLDIDAATVDMDATTVDIAAAGALGLSGATGVTMVASGGAVDISGTTIKFFGQTGAARTEIGNIDAALGQSGTPLAIATDYSVLDVSGTLIASGNATAINDNFRALGDRLNHIIVALQTFGLFE